MNILVDIGNSRLKWVVEQAGIFQPGAALDYRQVDMVNELLTVWQTLPVPQKLALSSVAEPELTAKIVELTRKLWPKLELLIPKASAAAFGVTNAYPSPEKLGVNRWLALLAAHHYYPGHACIVDCGTAVTVDVIDRCGRHLGGLISPGLYLMKKTLAANTAALGFIAGRHHYSLSNNTAAAIDSGTVFAVLGMVERVLRSLDQPYRLIFSGGDAALIAGQLQEPCIVDTELVFKGLSMFCNSGEMA